MENYQDITQIHYRDTENIEDPVERQAVRQRLVDAVFLKASIVQYGAKSSLEVAATAKPEINYPRTEDLLRLLNEQPVQITLGAGKKHRVEVTGKKSKKYRQRVAVLVGEGGSEAPKRIDGEGLPLHR